MCPELYRFFLKCRAILMGLQVLFTLDSLPKILQEDKPHKPHHGPSPLQFLTQTTVLALIQCFLRVTNLHSIHLNSLKFHSLLFVPLLRHNVHLLIAPHSIKCSLIRLVTRLHMCSCPLVPQQFLLMLIHKLHLPIQSKVAILYLIFPMVLA